MSDADTPHKTTPAVGQDVAGARPPPRPIYIPPLLLAAILALLAAIWAGWIRIGWNWPVIQPGLVLAHGPLMISGFFGTLIGLERAVALRRRWPFSGPVLTGLGGLALMAGAPAAPAWLFFAGSLVLGGVFIIILRTHPALYTAVMAAGAAAWAVGNLLWLIGWPVYRIIPWWTAFLILTIAGERLELGRLIRHTPPIERLFLLAFGVYAAGLVIGIEAADFGARLGSLGMVALAAWLLRYDIARRTIRQPGLPRFAAICLLGGYIWLGIGGLLGMWAGAAAAGFLYDAFLHAVLLGFVFAMIFAHAPIIFPAVLGLPIAFNVAFYLPLVLLHVSLLARIGGDLLSLPQLRAWGGLLNGITLLTFLATIFTSILAGRRRPVG